jgi:cytochrome c-type biogenesis protein CcmH
MAERTLQASTRPAAAAAHLRAILGGLLFLVALLAPLAGAHAKEATPAAQDPVLEARMLRIAAELRCLVCQNQTIADSNADLAVDLRRQVREALQRGDSERQIIDYMTARYGDFVLYRPPVRADTALLWFGPLVLLVAGLATLVLILYRRSRLSADRFEPDGDLDDAYGELEAADADTSAGVAAPREPYPTAGTAQPVDPPSAGAPITSFPADAPSAERNKVRLR